MQNRTDQNKLVILRTLAYYDIFNYPLTEKDILSSCIMFNSELLNCKEALAQLLEKGMIYKIGDFFTLQNSKHHINARIDGNLRAKNWMVKARRFSRFIGGFPYVRGIALSGSLSKGFIGEDPDIDYFIITQPNRLWLARTMLVLFKKVFLLNSYKYFCINYFIDTDNLEIEEKNLFTATEVSTLKPVFGPEITKQFFKQNQWVKNFFPNFEGNGITELNRSPVPIHKRILEYLLNGKIGDWLDTRFMILTTNHWAKKFKEQYSDEEFDLVFKSSKKISKHHPRNFQTKVLEAYRLKLQELQDKFDIEFEPALIEEN